MADQKEDRVAAVDVIVGSFNDRPTTETTPRKVAQHVVRTLDNAGLLLTEKRRALVEATVDHEAALTDIRIKTNATPEETTVQAVLRVMFERDMAVPALARLRAEQAALLRELAGDEGADDPWEATRDEAYREAASPKPTPAHEHHWAAIAWADDHNRDTDQWVCRVTREHCVVGDCPATREVTHGA